MDNKTSKINLSLLWNNKQEWLIHNQTQETWWNTLQWNEAISRRWFLWMVGRVALSIPSLATAVSVSSLIPWLWNAKESKESPIDFTKMIDEVATITPSEWWKTPTSISFTKDATAVRKYRKNWGFYDPRFVQALASKIESFSQYRKKNEQWTDMWIATINIDWWHINMYDTAEHILPIKEWLLAELRKKTKEKWLNPWSRETPLFWLEIMLLLEMIHSKMIQAEVAWRRWDWRFVEQVLKEIDDLLSQITKSAKEWNYVSSFNIANSYLNQFIVNNWDIWYSKTSKDIWDETKIDEKSLTKILWLFYANLNEVKYDKEKHPEIAQQNLARIFYEIWRKLWEWYLLRPSAYIFNKAVVDDDSREKRWQKRLLDKEETCIARWCRILLRMKEKATIAMKFSAWDTVFEELKLEWQNSTKHIKVIDSKNRKYDHWTSIESLTSLFSRTYNLVMEMLFGRSTDSVQVSIDWQSFETVYSA